MSHGWDEQTLAEARRLALRAARTTLPASLPAAEDVAQQTVIALMLKDPAEVTDWRPWVWKAARNAAIDQIRDRKRRGGPVAQIDAGDDEAPAPPTRAWARGPSQAGMWPAVWDAFTEALSERERTLLLADLDGASYAELAEDFGYANANTVSVTLTRIRRKLRAAYPTRGDVLDLLGDQRIY